MKKYYLLYTFIYTWASLAVAAGIHDPSKVSLSQSQFPACDGIKFISKKDFNKKPEYWNKKCHNGEKIQILPEDGGFFFKLQNATASLSLLTATGEKVLAIMDEKIKGQEKILDCFKSEKSTPACEKIKSDEINNLYTQFPIMRQNLALAEGKDLELKGVKRGSPGTLEFPKVEDAINSSLSKSALGLSGVFRADGLEPLSPGEKFQASNTMAEHLDEIKNSKELKTDHQRLLTFNQMRATYKAKYLETLQKAPLLMNVGKLPAKHEEQRISSLFIEGIEKNLKLAKKERGSIQSQWSRASMTAPLPFSRAKRAVGDENRSKEILSFIAYQPIVNEVLKEQVKENPYMCAVAQGLIEAHSTEELKSNGLIVGGVVTGAVALTALTGGLGALVLPEMVPVIGGMALSAQTATAIVLGPGIGFYSRSVDQGNFEKSKALVSSGIKSVESVDQEDAGVVIGNATIGLDFVGIGLFKFAGQKIFSKLAESTLKAEGLSAAEAKRLLEIGQSTASHNQKQATEAMTKINESLKKRLKAIFPKKDVSKDELDALSSINEMKVVPKEETLKDFFARLDQASMKADKKKILTDAVEILKKQKPEFFNSASPQDLTELNKQIVAIARYGEVKDPEKIALMLSTWQPKAKEKLNTVFDEAFNLVNQTNFHPGKSLSERRTLAFKETISKRGINSSEKQMQLCTCADVCKGSVKISFLEINNFDLTKIHVCAKNESSLFVSLN